MCIRDRPKIVCPFSGIALATKQRSATKTPKTQIDFIYYVQTFPSGKITPLVSTKHPNGLASVVVTIQ